MKYLLTFCIFTILTTLLTAQVSKTINVQTAGTLTTMLSATEKTTVTELTITGKIDASDFKFMQDNLTSLSTLDLTNVSIVEYSGSDVPPPIDPGNLTYPANEIPHGSFLNNSTLTTSSVALTFNIHLYCIEIQKYRSVL